METSDVSRYGFYFRGRIPPLTRIATIWQMGVGILALTTHVADAQTSTSASTLAQTQATSNAPVASTVGTLPGLTPSSAGNTVGASPTAPINKWYGININLAPPENTLDGNLGGLRQKLSDDYGIGYFGFSLDTMYSNVLHSAKRTNNQQLYNGQSPTGQSVNFYGLTFDLTRYGIPDGQIVVLASPGLTSWNPSGPNAFVLGTVSYYQTFLNKRVEIKLGLLGESFEFVGPYVAGSLSGGLFGVSGSLFYQGGESGLNAPTYGTNVTVHITKNFYDKVGVFRAVSPGGLVTEHNQNQIGPRWSVSNAGVEVVNEVGYQVRAQPGTEQTWLRTGAFYSGSQYVDYDDGGRDHGNYVTYALGDRQLLQVSRKPGEAYRGLYAGVSAEYAPSSLNRFSQYYELRLYGLGLLPGRAHDLTSVVLADTYFSRVLQEQAFAKGLLAHHDAKQITGLYSFRITPGLYVNGGLTYVNNPTSVTYTSKTGSALILLAGFAISL